jgi:predicted Zn-dependent protease
MRLLVVLALAFGVASCAPLYGGRPEKLKNPEKKKKPPEVEAAAPEIKYVEECSANFSDDPKKAHPQTPMSKQLFDAGESSYDQADKATDDKMKVNLLKEAIDKYRNALIKDPYNVPATLKLAVAYDRVLRKGCAIAMLKRLAALSNNPKWASEANRNIDSIDANAQWFKGYRKDALAAVGR